MEHLVTRLTAWFPGAAGVVTDPQRLVTPTETYSLALDLFSVFSVGRCLLGTEVAGIP